MGTATNPPRNAPSSADGYRKPFLKKIATRSPRSRPREASLSATAEAEFESSAIGLATVATTDGRPVLPGQEAAPRHLQDLVPIRVRALDGIPRVQPRHAAKGLPGPPHEHDTRLEGHPPNRDKRFGREPVMKFTNQRVDTGSSDLVSLEKTIENWFEEIAEDRGSPSFGDVFKGLDLKGGKLRHPRVRGTRACTSRPLHS